MGLYGPHPFLHMSAVIQSAKQPKVFYALGVRKFKTTGADPKHLPPLMIAAMCLARAKNLGCEEICITPEGMRPRYYKVADVEAKVRANPMKFKGLVNFASMTTPEQLRRQQVIAGHQLRNGIYAPI